MAPAVAAPRDPTLQLSRLKIENFRIFGSGSDALDLEFEPGLTLLVGPNDGGKTAVVDAVRLVVGTTARDTNRVVEDDFHYDDSGQASSFRIACRFDFADPAESAPFFEHLTPESSGPALHLIFTAVRQPNQPKRTVVTDLRSGPDGTGPRPDGTMRALMAATYLRALRDALDELTAGRGSRLSQILHAHPQYAGESISDFKSEDVAGDGAVAMPKTLVGTMRLAEHGIEQNRAVRWTRDQLNEQYLDRLSLADDAIHGEVGITRAAELRDILEKLDLWIASIGGKSVRIKRGLGTNNILYMASEMLLVGASGEDGLPLLLIEEPEAHLHPQMQLLVGDFLREQSARTAGARRRDGERFPLQVVATTHSPTLASQVELEQLVVIAGGKAFPLRKGCTGLDTGDYRFLSKFLDATRANLFFARGVLIVEGDAENLLLPALARLLDLPLNKHGVSIVNVGTVGLFRYSRIFVGPDGSARVPVRAACITDLDLAHDAPTDEKAKRLAARTRNEGGTVRTFVSEFETLEYVLAASPFAKEIHLAIALARRAKNTGGPVKDADRAEVERTAAAVFAQLERDSAGDRYALAERIYEPLAADKASKPEAAQYLGELLLTARERGEVDAASARERLPAYIVDAIDYVTWKKDFPPHAPDDRAVAEEP